MHEFKNYKTVWGEQFLKDSNQNQMDYNREQRKEDDQ